MRPAGADDVVGTGPALIAAARLTSVTTGTQGKVDLVPLHAIHAEQGGPTRPVAIMARGFVTAAVALAVTSGASAQTASEFKTLKIVVGFSTGDGYDTYLPGCGGRSSANTCRAPLRRD
jgi:hypothetical protein